MENILEVSGVTEFLPDGDGVRKILSDFGLSVGRGEVRVVENGSREEARVLYEILVGDREPTSGRIVRAEGTVGRIRHEAETFPRLRVHEIMALALGGRYRKGTAREYGFDPRCEASGLSPEERKKLQLILRFLQKPVCIIADDPFDGLDDEASAQLMEFIRGEAEKTGAAVVLLRTKDEKD